METYGTTEDVVAKIASDLGVGDEREIIATLFYMRIGHWALAADANLGFLKRKGRKTDGYCSEGRFREHVTGFLATKGQSFVPVYLSPEDGMGKKVYEHEANTTQGVVPGCRLAIDTVPCRVDNLGNTNVFFQAKYATCCVKKLCAVTFSGFFIEVTKPFVYTGPSADNVLLEHSGLLKWLHDNSTVCLADGGFTRTERVHTPFTKDEIWPPKRRTQTPNDYKGEADAKLNRNAHLCFWRARVEHAFSDAQLGRFSLLQRYEGKTHQLLLLAFYFGQAVLNVENFQRHGPEGRYSTAPVPEALYAKSLVAQNDRYPQAQGPAKRPGKKESNVAPENQPALDEWLSHPPLTQTASQQI